MDSIAELARREHADGQKEHPGEGATLEEIETILREDDIANIMAEPAGPLKKVIPGRSPSGAMDADTDGGQW